MKKSTHFIPLTVLFILLVGLSGSLYAQKFGDIDMQRLKETAHPTDPKASHAYIFKNCMVRYDFESRSPRMVTEYHYRIKIYTNEGLDAANVVQYLSQNKKEREGVADVKAECYNLVDGKKEKSKLSKKDIYKEEINEDVRKVSFAIPNVRPGSIIEFRYKVYSPFLYAFPRHYFQVDVPVDYSRLRVNVPDYFSMAPTATGMIALNRTQEAKQSFGASVTQFTFDASDIPGIEDDQYVLDIDDYRSSLKFELSQVDFPGRAVQNFTKDWNSICENLMDSPFFGDAINNKVRPATEFLERIESLTEEEKLLQIVDFINTHIVWNGDIGKYGTTKYKKLFETKSGNSAEINLLLINLCKKAKLEAYPILTKYRFHGLLNTGFPSLTELNYVFALVIVDGKEMFVDATSPYFKPGTLPLRAMNVEAILVKEEKGQLFTMSNTNLNYLRQAAKYTINLEEERLEGTGKAVIKDYAAVKARKKNKEEEEEDQQVLIKESEEEEDQQELGKESDEEEDDYEEEAENVYTYTETKGMENKYGNITSTFDAILYSPFDAIGNEVYIDAFVSLEFEGNPFFDKIRKYPAFFNSKHHFNHVSILEVPEGYAVKSIPDNLKMKIINDKGYFSYSINESPGKITVNCLFQIDHDMFNPNEYASLYAFFDRVLQKQNEKIVLVRE
ncbi:MAG: DUF3857 domain-containing protein [Bacteroidota bacterium]